MPKYCAKRHVCEDEVTVAWLSRVLADTMLKSHRFGSTIEINDSALPCPVRITLNPIRKALTFETFDSVCGLTELEALRLANDTNVKHDYAHFYIRGSEIHASCQLSYEDGLMPRQVVANLLRYVKAFNAGANFRINRFDVEDAGEDHLGL